MSAAQSSTHPRIDCQPQSTEEWIEFIFDGIVPATVSKNLFVCANHFLSDFFTSLDHYKAGLATKLFLKVRSIPAVCGKTADQRNLSI